MFPSHGEEVNRECTAVPETSCSSGCGFGGLQFAIGVHHGVNGGGFSKLCPRLFGLACVNGKPETGSRRQIFPFLVRNFIQKSIPPAFQTRIGNYASDCNYSSGYAH